MIVMSVKNRLEELQDHSIGNHLLVCTVVV
jgi:hypothetical protein